MGRTDHGSWLKLAYVLGHKLQHNVLAVLVIVRETEQDLRHSRNFKSLLDLVYIDLSKSHDLIAVCDLEFVPCGDHSRRCWIGRLCSCGEFNRAEAEGRDEEDVVLRENNPPMLEAALVGWREQLLGRESEGKGG